MTSEQPSPRRWLSVLINAIVCLAILAASAAAVVMINRTEPTAQQINATRKSAALVETVAVQRGTYSPSLVVLGTVEPAQDVVLSPRVNGQVMELSPEFIPGGMVRKGDMLLRIDLADFENALSIRESELQQAEASLKIEGGRQSVARKDLELLADSIGDADRALVLREPQLASIKAEVSAAEAAVGRAKLDLDRTTVFAPFDAQVLSRSVNIGSQVALGDELGQLVGIEEYWIIAAVPVRSLRWVQFPESERRGSAVTLSHPDAWGPDTERQARVTRLIGTLDQQTRLAKVLITVPDPLGQKSDAPPLILDTLIEVRIEGKPIEGVVRLSREYVHERDTAWVMKDGELEVRETDIVFQDAEYAYIRTGLESGEEVVTTTLATVADGVGLRKVDDRSAAQDLQRGVDRLNEHQDGSDSRRSWIAWMARNSIAANLLMFILLGGGLWSAVVIQKEVFPEYLLDVVEVRVGYPGAAPEEVEQGILRPIEGAVRGLEGIQRITSEAREGRGEVLIELIAGQDRMKAYQEIDQAISRIRTFPDQIEQPEVRLQSEQREVMEVAIYGPIDIWALRKLAEQLRDQLQAKDEITQVELSRVPQYVTHVEIPRQRLREYGLTLPAVADVIRTSSQDVAAGSVQTSAGEILLRVKARKQWADEFARIEIVAGRDGPLVTLGEIATIRDGFEEVGFHSQFSQTPSVELDIFRTGSQSPLDIARAVEETMREFESVLPPGVKWRIDRNNAEEFRRRLNLVLKNAAMAVGIVLLILALFLEFRLAFWVMMGMAVSFIGGVLLLPLAGVSINMISLFGFLVVLGIVVDDAVVVGENVYEKRLSTNDYQRAAVDGTREVASPVIFSILTNIVAFVPLMFIPGETGKFWGPLPVVVIIVLSLSLLESLFILPAHLAHAKAGGGNRHGLGSRLHHGQQGFSRAFNRLVEIVYRPVLLLCLRFRYITACVALGLFLVVGGYATSAHMGMILMPEVSADEIEAGVRMPVGTTQDQSAEIARVVTEASLRMFDEHNLYEVAEGIKTNVRGQDFIDVEIVMKPPDQRDMTANEVIELWRDSIGDLPGVDQVTFEAERGPGGGRRRDISVSLSHSDIDVLEKASLAFVERAERFANVRDVNDDYNKGKAQYDFRLRPEGRALGLTDEGLGEQLRGAFFGSLALRLLRGTNEIEVRVKLPEEQREDIHHMEDLVIRTPSGAEVPLLDVADMDKNVAFEEINRRDGRRAVNVSMDIEPKRAITQVIAALRNEALPQLRDDFPGITWTFEGSDAEMRRATSSLWGYFGLALAVIYSLLAVAFRGYVQPLIVLVAIPFGIVGAVLGHIWLGYDISLVSLMGVIALSGVVINDSLIMIDYANRRRGDHSAFEAISQAGLRRFRPILLTTLTTFGGLMPLIFEDSLQAQYIIPMAISLAFGILFATAIILVLVPCLYLILEDIRLVTRVVRRAEV